MRGCVAFYSLIPYREKDTTHRPREDHPMTDCECHRENTSSHESCCGYDNGRSPDCPQHGDGSGPNAVHQPVGFARWHNPAVFATDDRVTVHPFVPVEGHVVCGDCGFARGSRLGNRPLHPLPRVNAVTA